MGTSVVIQEGDLKAQITYMNEYPTGIKVDDEEYDRVDIDRIDPMPDWNYVIRGFNTPLNLKQRICGRLFHPGGVKPS